MNKYEVAIQKGYKIDINGVAYSKNRRLSVVKSRGGYLYFSVRDFNGKRVNIFVHRLQAYQKFGDKILEECVVVRHLNNNSCDNSNANIDIGTQSENMMDRDRVNRLNQAIYASSFLKKYDNSTIRDFHSISNSYKKTMNEFNITSKGTLWHILNR